MRVALLLGIVVAALAAGSIVVSARGERRGTFLGVPYDWRKPTLSRIRERVWNPDDRRVFTPKSFGWGWDINVARVWQMLRARVGR